MNEVEKCIRERRSTPRFKQVPVARELVERVIEAGLWAPSGMGKQSPIIVAVTNRKLRDELAEENRRIMGAPEGMDPFYGAPVVLVVLASAAMPTRVYDGSATIENMLLAAQSLGLGATGSTVPRRSSRSLATRSCWQAWAWRATTRASATW